MKCIEKRVLFMGKRNKVTTRDIAEYTGVSQSTVSMILSNKPHVSFSKETIDKVRQGAKELGYKKPVASVKKKEQTLAKSIIVICPLLSNGYYSMIIHSITERAKDYGYTVFTVSTLRDVSQEELYLNLLSGFELAGVISLYPPTKIAQANALSKQVPVVPSVINQMHAVLMQLNLTVKSLDILLLNIFSLLDISILLISVHRSAQKRLAGSIVLLGCVLVLKIMVLIQNGWR